MAYEVNTVTSDDDEMSMMSGQTPDLLSTMSARHRHTSRHSLLDEIVKQVHPRNQTCFLVPVQLQVEVFGCFLCFLH